MTPLLYSHAPKMRAIAERMGIPGLAAVARQAGVQAAYRVSVHYHDRRASDTVATVTVKRLEGARLALRFEGSFGDHALAYRMVPGRVEAFARALAALRFDKMLDQPDLPMYDVTDLWFVERASGAFARGVVIAPALALEAYAALAQAVQSHLPEVLRQLG